MEYSNQLIDNLLQKYESVIGSDLNRYKNHVCRVYLYCGLLDDDKNNAEKYAIAAVFHDIGIWTNNTFDYLDPSIKLAKQHLTSVGKQEWIPEISLMINWHHKMSKYQGDFEKTVECFRKADWIDVSIGLITYNVDKQKLKTIKIAKPYLGFHLFLVRKSIVNFFKHPLNPLPMFKK